METFKFLTIGVIQGGCLECGKNKLIPSLGIRILPFRINHIHIISTLWLENWTQFSENKDEGTPFCLLCVLEAAEQKEVVKSTEGGWIRNPFHAMGEAIIWVSQYQYQFRLFVHLSLKCLGSSISPGYSDLNKASKVFQYILAILLQGPSLWKLGHFFGQWVPGLKSCQRN